MATACANQSQTAKMDRRVTIQQVTEASDGQGGQTETWADVATVWASINPMSDYEKFQAQQLQTNTTHKLTIRYRTGLTTKHRVLFGTRIFNIKGIVNPGEANFFLNLKCIETT